MKNVKFWSLAVLTTALIFATFYAMIAQIDDKLKTRLPDTTEAETEAVIVFEEVKEIPSDETEAEIQPLYAEESNATLSEGREDIQPGFEEVSVIYASAGEVLTEPETVPLAICTDSDLLLLAKLIQSEAGYDFCSDEHQRAVASVLLNHVASPSPDFPDSVYGCIFSGWVDGGIKHYGIGSYAEFMSIVPSERAIANAAYVMQYGSTVGDAIYQAEFIQGEIVAVFSYPGTGAMTTYICR